MYLQLYYSESIQAAIVAADVVVTAGPEWTPWVISVAFAPGLVMKLGSSAEYDVMSGGDIEGWQPVQFWAVSSGSIIEVNVAAGSTPPPAASEPPVGAASMPPLPV